MTPPGHLEQPQSPLLTTIMPGEASDQLTRLLRDSSLPYPALSCLWPFRIVSTNTVHPCFLSQIKFCKKFDRLSLRHQGLRRLRVFHRLSVPGLRLPAAGLHARLVPPEPPHRLLPETRVPRRRRPRLRGDAAPLRGPAGPLAGRAHRPQVRPRQQHHLRLARRQARVPQVLQVWKPMIYPRTNCLLHLILLNHVLSIYHQAPEPSTTGRRGPLRQAAE